MQRTQGDFVELINEDFKAINEQQNDDMIKNTNTVLYKKHIKAKMRISALKYLTDIQAKHSKVKHIKHPKLETQKYMTSPIFSNEDVNLLYALRSGLLSVKKISDRSTSTPIFFVHFVKLKMKISSIS